MSGKAILSLPAHKVLLSQLKSDVTKDDDVKYSRWNVTFCSKAKHKVTNVWIQGYITPFKPKDGYNADDELLVNDGTGSCLIIGLSKIPKVKETREFKPGNRVLVIGYLSNAGLQVEATKRQYQNNEIIAKLKAIKLTEVTKNPNCVFGSEWKKEVFDAQTAVLNSIYG